MTEGDVRDILREQFNVSRETMTQLERLVDLVIAESAHQNLISASTIPHFWERHILDSAQLLALAPSEGVWIDLGSGAGFPGIVIAIMRAQPMILVEERRKRFVFLHDLVEALNLKNVTVHGGRLETMPATRAAVISARAFAPLDKLLTLAHRFSYPETLWILPKGKSAQEELEAAQESWQGVFHVKQSITDSDAAIIVASQVRPRV